MKNQTHHTEHPNHYKRFVIMLILSFIAMYILMYSMVDSFSNVISNINQFYMAGLMTAPMILIELALMGTMYKNKKANISFMFGGLALLIFCFFAIRKQAGVGDKQFVKSMIPHHAAAILMVKGAELEDPELQKLAEDIISAQQKEIDFMKAKLKQLEQK